MPPKRVSTPNESGSKKKGSSKKAAPSGSTASSVQEAPVDPKPNVLAGMFKRIESQDLTTKECTFCHKQIKSCLLDDHMRTKCELRQQNAENGSNGGDDVIILGTKGLGQMRKRKKTNSPENAKDNVAKQCFHIFTDSENENSSQADQKPIKTENDPDASRIETCTDVSKSTQVKEEYLTQQHDFPYIEIDRADVEEISYEDFSSHSTNLSVKSSTTAYYQIGLFSSTVSTETDILLCDRVAQEGKLELPINHFFKN